MRGELERSEAALGRAEPLLRDLIDADFDVFARDDVVLAQQLTQLRFGQVVVQAPERSAERELLAAPHARLGRVGPRRPRRRRRRAVLGSVRAQLPKVRADAAKRRAAVALPARRVGVSRAVGGVGSVDDDLELPRRQRHAVLLQRRAEHGRRDGARIERRGRVPSTQSAPQRDEDPLRRAGLARARGAAVGQLFAEFFLCGPRFWRFVRRRLPRHDAADAAVHAAQYEGHVHYSLAADGFLPRGSHGRLERVRLQRGHDALRDLVLCAGGETEAQAGDLLGKVVARDEARVGAVGGEPLLHVEPSGPR
mmetsp:Transcript_32242/g.110949  ORF Transcript_32242/g.110949 Transcript_32242/m.110949 type:complete len:309 (-) Transcript_32242:135-1061(-)